MRFQEQHAEHQERFQILAFHDDRVATLEELDQKLARIREQIWKGKDLPFPVLLDSTGQTIRTFGIEAFPTNLLIDPEGNVVGEFGLDRLARELGLAE